MELDDDFVQVDDADSDGEPEISMHALTCIHAGDTMHLVTKIADRSLRALVDSGSTHSFIATSAASQLGVVYESRPGLSVAVANGDRVLCAGVCRALPITIAHERFDVDLYVLPLDNYDVVLGCSWLKTLGPILWDFDRKSMAFWRNGHRVHWRDASATSPARVHAMGQADLLALLLAEFAVVFDAPEQLPPARRLDHRIHLLPATAPIAVRPYRYPQLLKDEIERQCEEMLRLGIIRPSTSAFSSPVLLVRKKDGTWRFCIDFRALNSKTVRDMFPIPVVDELLDELKGACFFTKLDLASGYHQVRMHPDDIHKTAFWTHHGHFEFVVMPFGLTNAPSTFQALMNEVLRPFLRKLVLVFFDDILI